jgi:hypothetical protein
MTTATFYRSCLVFSVVSGMAQRLQSTSQEAEARMRTSVHSSTSSELNLTSAKIDLSGTNEPRSGHTYTRSFLQCLGRASVQSNSSRLRSFRPV